MSGLQPAHQFCGDAEEQRVAIVQAAGDERLHGLMGHGALKGERSVDMWGLTYNGTLESAVRSIITTFVKIRSVTCREIKTSEC